MPEGFSGLRREKAESIETLRAENERLRGELAAERAAKEEALRQLDEAGHDALTGIPLRKRFETVAGALFAKEPKEGEKTRVGLPPRLALIFSDIDHFKSVNDTYGHDAGDEVLRTVAKTLSGGIRPTDLICRWGGEEIVILLPGAAEAEAAARAEELRARLEALAYKDIGNGEFHATASFGVASAENNGSVTLEELAKSADEALYLAKDTGRNKVVTAKEAQARRAQEPEQLEMPM